MNLRHFIGDIEPAPSAQGEQDDYEVVVEYSDETGRAIFPISDGDVEFDHNERRVIIRVNGGED